jgi:hypothetical protein
VALRVVAVNSRAYYIAITMRVVAVKPRVVAVGSRDRETDIGAIKLFSESAPRSA